jgi:hypothetical protein
MSEGNARAQRRFEHCLVSGHVTVTLTTAPTVAPNGTYICIWHVADQQHAGWVGRPAAELPAFAAECLLIAAFQTLRRRDAKVGT